MKLRQFGKKDGNGFIDLFMSLPISSIHFGGQIVKDVTELNSGWKEYTSKVELDPVKQDLLESQFLRFRGLHEVDFGSARASLRDAHLKPVSWWEKYSGDCPDLQHIALRFLSQDCSSGACERNWSLFAAIHTKKRNCLSPIQLKCLVYVNSNLKLLQKREKTKSINEINPESFKIEIHLAELVHPINDDDEVWAFIIPLVLNVPSLTLAAMHEKTQGFGDNSTPVTTPPLFTKSHGDDDEDDDGDDRTTRGILTTSKRGFQAVRRSPPQRAKGNG
ncbi:hypothetical protein L7F22_023740 [Adiantum nelumboides]|nr:hypothetical protein [Adiantum nelumboides]